MIFLRKLLITLLLIIPFKTMAQNGAVVFQTDFGLKDGAVSAMKGVAFSVSRDLKLFDLTHEIPAFNIWEAAYRLHQTASYWPLGTVFVSVVDPGVGSARRSVVLKTNSGHFFVSPDNGTLTFVAATLGVAELRQIDETRNRLKGSQDSYTFHGRDVYAYTAARIAAGVISGDGIGPLLKPEVVSIPYQKPVFAEQKIEGNIPILDVQYGNVWTNIDQALFKKLGITYGDKVHFRILHQDETVCEGDAVFGHTFSDVPEGQAVAYINSLLNFSLGINQGDFSARYKVFSGPGWKIILSKG
jgi:S-adenosylmethionine hydrolase